MKRFALALAALCAAASPAVAQSDATAGVPSATAETAIEADEPTAIVPAENTAPEEWLWQRRPVVVFADSPNDPRYVQQMEFINDRLDALLERDVIVITDTDPGGRSAFRQELRPRGFMLAVLAKDGSILTRKPAPWSVREINRTIDKEPLRQQEVRDRINAGS